MLSKADDFLIDERLKNWGAWAADRKHLGVSVLYKMMMKYGDVERRLGNTARNEVDLMDALLVNRAWQGLPNTPLRYKTAKWILVAHYAYPTMPIQVACRKLKVSPEDYETLLRTARYMIFNRIVQHASKVLQTIRD